MRTSRIRATVLAAATATLALSLTACGGGDTSTKSDAAPQSQSASGGDAKGDAAQANSGKDTKDETRSTSASGGTGTAADKGGDTAGVGQCVGDELLLTAEHRFAGQQGDHLLITASNEGSKPCTVTSYPSVKIDGEGATLPLSKKAEGGHQQIMLRPGGKVYSAVNIFDYGKDNKTGTGLSVALRDNNGHQKPAYSVDLKGEKPQFTYNEADVLNWNAKKPYDF
ncbi:DUF4232 domain-containing protein [Streptomyces sp. NPDC059080]|uniref:DUF4232 domain-containing protein n=1 Tax=Streptomyces sp. NPDC059080 TaxID=3346718 RepID=UPI0036D0E0DB